MTLLECAFCCGGVCLTLAHVTAVTTWEDRRDRVRGRGESYVCSWSWWWCLCSAYGWGRSWSFQRAARGDRARSSVLQSTKHTLAHTPTPTNEWNVSDLHSWGHNYSAEKWERVAPAAGVDVWQCRFAFQLLGVRPIPRTRFAKGLADLDEDRNHGDAVRALGRLGVVGIQILVVMDELDLWKHEEKNRCKGPVTVCRLAFTTAPSLSLAEVTLTFVASD